MEQKTKLIRAVTIEVFLRRIMGSIQSEQEEFYSLVTAVGAVKVNDSIVKREHADSQYLIGKGKVAEISASLSELKPDVVIFNRSLSPIQERNLEKAFNCPVWDRTRLILKIFAQRARSFEGKLQVELAECQHQATRLVRGWTHLERQRGGIGLRGGPGETQLEADRRLIRQRIKLLKQRLEKLAKQRHQGRRGRQRSQIPTVALVGYTNAGKSTLFNRLVTDGSTSTANMLFTTLDPLLRRVFLPGLGVIVIVDTVGFIRDLPHELVEAFHATLEESCEADLLLQVVDGSDLEKKSKIAVVNQVLEQIGAAGQPQLLVLNKIDLLDDFAPRTDYDPTGRPQQVWVSAESNLGMPQLFAAIRQLLTQFPVADWVPTEQQLEATKEMEG